ncbi:UNVERIFIED_CONTAM: hypothetical protein Sradi_0039400 [Sesamum radiatum]|uniref:Uncharacterized protein n=1 Tax=Sesamum radiatum TaxID=300843 RepID=A0AAW2WI07_SESRA
MPQLRCIDVRNVILPNPVDIQDSIVLENLDELSFVYEFKCTKEVLERIPNLKILSLRYYNYAKDWSYYCLHNLVHLRKLESLSLCAKKLLLETIVLPTSLKKLSLNFGGIPWEDMTLIGSLPNLEILNLWNNAFKGYEWSPVEGQFLIRYDG